MPPQTNNPYAEFQQPAANPYAEFQAPAAPSPVNTALASVPKPSGSISAIYNQKPEPSSMWDVIKGAASRADDAINRTLAPNSQNYSSIARTQLEVPKTLGREVYAGAQAIPGLATGAYHSVVDPLSEEEKANGQNRLEAIPERLLGGEAIANAIQDYTHGRVTPEAALSVAPEALGQGGGTVIGGKLAANAYAGAKTAAPEILRKAAGTVSDAVMSPQRKMMAGGRPSVAEPNFEQNVKTAAPRLAEQQRISPAKNAADVADMAHTAAEKLWKEEVEPQIGRHADETIDGKAVADQVRGSVDEGTRELFPKEAETAEEFAKKFDGPLTLDKANAYLKAINAQLKSFYKMSPDAQHAAGVTSGRVSALEGAADNLRDQMYSKLDDLGEQNPRGIRQEYGALKNVQRVFGKSATVAGRQPMLDMPTKLGLLGGAAGAMLEAGKGNIPGAIATGVGVPAMGLLTKYLNGRDFMSSSGMAGLERVNPAVAAAAPELRLTPPPGQVPEGLVRQMPFALEENHPGQQPFARVGGENVPGKDLQLTPPAGQMPADFQRPMPFEGGEAIQAQKTPDILGQGLVSKEPLTLSSPGEMPPDAQRPLPITEPPAIEPRRVYPGQANGASGGPSVPPTEGGSAPKTPSPKGGGGGKSEIAQTAEDFLSQLKKNAAPPDKLPGDFTIDRQAESMALAENAAGKLPKDTSVVQRAQQLKEQLQATQAMAPNASGESGASLEAIRRAASEKAGGSQRYRIDTRSGAKYPLIGPDAVDAKAGPYDVIVSKTPIGDVELDRGARARRYNLK